jgi:transposase
VIDVGLKQPGAATQIGVTDMRRGLPGLAAQVQAVLKEKPYSGHVFAFRGRRGDTVKLLWFDGDGLCLFQKRLERGRFVSVVEGHRVSRSRPSLQPRRHRQRRPRVG